MYIHIYIIVFKYVVCRWKCDLAECVLGIKERDNIVCHCRSVSALCLEPIACSTGLYTKEDSSYEYLVYKIWVDFFREFIYLYKDTHFVI